MLDPEQNHNFNDHYLEVDYDLSDVLFICTSNSMRMPQPLADRTEIIRLSGYTEDEKLGIVRQHLLDKQTKAAGLKKDEFSITDDAIRDLIRYYTREAGVRNLERELANLARKTIKEILMGKRKELKITSSNLGTLAMEHMAPIAGTASSVQGVIGTIGAAAIGFVIGQLFDGTLVPFAVGTAACAAGGFLLIVLTEPKRLFARIGATRTEIIPPVPEEVA